MRHRRGGGSRVRSARRPSSEPAVAGLCIVYRSANAPTVRRLVEEGERSGWSIRLHALDAVAAELRQWTVTAGPGAKFDILDELMAVPAPPGWWVLADDDVEVVRGSLGRALQRAEAWDLDLAQPAHHRRSHWNYHVTVGRPLRRARVTTFVEIGPVLLVSERAASLVTPFRAGMGFGLEHRWQRDHVLRVGVVDEVRIDHLSPTGTTYDDDELWRTAERRLGVSRAQNRALDRRTLASWWVLRPGPPPRRR